MFNLRRAFRILASILVGASMLVPVTQAAFSDVSGGEFATYILDLEAKGIVSGSNGLFFPRNNLTRGEMAKIVVLANNMTVDTSGSQRFPDVSSSNTFYVYVQTLANRGIVGGYADGTFRPSNNISRGEFSKMIVGAFAFMTNTAGGPHFSDVPTSQTFYVHVETLYNLNVISGYNAFTFGVNDYVTREQMAKIVSRSLMSKAGTLPPRAPAVGVIKKEFPLAFNYVLPRAHVEPNTARTRFELTVERFPRLAGGFMYELWVKDSAGLHSAGRFNVRDGVSLADERGIAISANFNFPMDFADATDIAISIEPNGDENSTPGATMVVKGRIDHSGDIFDVDFATGFLSSDARAYITATGTSNNILNIDFPTLPDIRSIGWSYEAWYVTENAFGHDVHNTAGVFSGAGGRMTFRSVQLPVDLLTVDRVMVSVEPNPDDSDAPSGIIPWSGDVPVTTTTTTGGSTSDSDLYKGLTTSMTTKSIRDRTMMETDASAEIIVQAYAGSPELADGEKQAIVIKVSDLDGNPIGDLDLTLSRVEGPSGNFSDPVEIGNWSGVYVGTYEADDPVTTTDNVVIRVQPDSGETVDVPMIEVEFKASSSSDNMGSPSHMEIDVTQKKMTIDENDPDLQNAEMVVVGAVQDNNDRGITDVLSSKLSLSAGSNTISGTVKGNVKTWKFDDNFFNVDSETSDITVSEDFVVQLIPSGSDGWTPLISTEYTVDCEFIAEI